MTLAEKLNIARKSLGKNKKEMADTVGVGTSSWIGYEKGNNIPGGNVFDALTKLGFNANWFFTDDPAVQMMISKQPQIMFIRERPDDEFTAFVRKPETDTLTDDSVHTTYPTVLIPQARAIDPTYFDYVPMAEAHLSAGGGAFVLSEQMGEMYSFRKEWLRRVASSPRNVVLMNVRGDSMAPTIKNGDTVLIDTGRRHIYDGNIYALRLEETIAIKRLSLLPGNRIMILSDNKAEYPPYNAEAKEVHVIGQVVWLARALTITNHEALLKDGEK
jgi:phage repressor protein C with HTH and peptisase S24 domain